MGELDRFMHRPVPGNYLAQRESSPQQNYLQNPKQSRSLLEQLREGVDVATPEQSKKYFKENDFRWGETLQGDDSPTGRPTIYINDSKYKGSSPAYRDKAVQGELLHL